MKVVVTRKIPGPAVDLLQQAGHEVLVFPDDRVQSVEELKLFVVGADAILSLLTDKITGEVMDSAGKQLKIIANYAVGFDNIDLPSAKERNIFVTNTPGGFEMAVAEHTMALMLAVARHVVQGDAYVRAGKYVQWEPELFVGMELKDKTLGILGMGRIGMTVAKAAKLGFGMKICYHSHKKVEQIADSPGKAGVNGQPLQDKQIEMEFYDDLEKMLSVSDVISIHVPLTSETKHLISKKELSSMKKSAILINTARGAVVDEAALVEALQQNWIAGAGLDVFEDETPISSETEKALWKLPNVVLTPHIASATMEARNEMSRTVAVNIIEVLSGKAPPNVAK